MTTTLPHPDVQTSPSTVRRIREILSHRLPLRTAVSLVEVELSGRQFSPFHRRTDREVQIARIAAVAFVTVGPGIDAIPMVALARGITQRSLR